MSSLTSRIALLSLVIIGVGCSGKGKDENAQATDIASAPDNATEIHPYTPAAETKGLGTLADLIVATANDLPKIEYDPAARAASLGKDPQKLFAWVRDQTWWVPYRGLLRGSRGVMIDRVGSNLDRAVLLGDLLRRNGHTVRLAHAQLAETQARELLPKVQSIPDRRRNPAASKPYPAERQRAIESIAPGLQQTIQKETAAGTVLLNEARALVSAQSKQLYAAVHSAAAAHEADDHSAIAALQDHWWVEYNDHGEWKALDVLLPDAQPGKVLAAASTTNEWPMDKDAPSISDADWHSVQIRVIVERYERGATSEFTVLDTSLRPAQVFDKPVTFSHLPRPWPDSIPSLRTDPNAMTSASLWITEWTPYLRVGEDFIVQGAFTDRGELKNNPLDPVGQLGGAGFMSGFDAALGGGGEEVESFATAEWIDFELRVPGVPNQRLRRPVFDILGPARRANSTADFNADADELKLQRADALLSRTDVLMQPCEFTADFVIDLATAGIVASQDELRQLSTESDRTKVTDLASTVLGRIESWGPLPGLALLRSTVAKQPGNWYIDRPNVLTYRAWRPKSVDGRVVQLQMIDIASNSIGVRRAAGTNSFQTRLEQGVSDTVAELVTLSDKIRDGENTASIFGGSTSGEPGVLIAPGKTESVQKLGWNADVAARIEGDITSGFMAVAIKEPVSLNGQQRVGWWRVDPGTGETIGVMDTGFHGFAEYKAQATVLIGVLVNFINNNPIPPFPFGAPRAVQLAHQTQYAGLIALHRVAFQTLRNAFCAGLAVPFNFQC